MTEIEFSIFRSFGIKTPVIFIKYSEKMPVSGLFRDHFTLK